MKTLNINKSLLILMVAVISLTGCKKDFVLSKPTYLPEVTLNGDAEMIVEKDDTYVEPGAVATENGVEIDYVIDGEVDESTPGVYVLLYTATNVDGYQSSATRIVLVTPGPVTDDVTYIEGKYETSPNGGTPASTFSNIRKVGPGVYYTENCWGNGSLAILPAYFFCLDGLTLEIPTQGEGAGQVQTNSPGSYNTGLGKISWTVTRPLFPGGPLTRAKTWVKG